MLEDFLEFINKTIIEPVDKYPFAALLVFFSIFVFFLAVAVGQSKIQSPGSQPCQCNCTHTQMEAEKP